MDSIEPHVLISAAVCAVSLHPRAHAHTQVADQRVVLSASAPGALAEHSALDRPEYP